MSATWPAVVVFTGWRIIERRNQHLPATFDLSALFKDSLQWSEQWNCRHKSPSHEMFVFPSCGDVLSATAVQMFSFCLLFSLFSSFDELFNFWTSRRSAEGSWTRRTFCRLAQFWNIPPKSNKCAPWPILAQMELCGWRRRYGSSRQKARSHSFIVKVPSTRWLVEVWQKQLHVKQDEENCSVCNKQSSGRTTAHCVWQPTSRCTPR